MARPGIAARLVCVLRWQEQNERQVWMLAAGYGLLAGSVYGAVTWHSGGLVHGAVGGLAFGGVGVIVFGLGRRYRFRQRRDAPWR